MVSNKFLSLKSFVLNCHESEGTSGSSLSGFPFCSWKSQVSSGLEVASGDSLVEYANLTYQKLQRHFAVHTTSISHKIQMRNIY